MSDVQVPVDTWKGVRIDKMPRKDLEAEFVKLAIAEVARLRTHPIQAEPDPKRVALDPQSRRCLQELRATIASIESGESGLRRYADVLTDEAGLHREISLRTTFIPPSQRTVR